MPTVRVGNTSKRINSTSNIFSGGASLDCKLKEPCSMHDPVFIVQGLSKGTFYNYASFEGRYYWVDDIIYLTNNIQEIHCHLDPLATFKDAIKDSHAFVVYGDVGHWNKKVDDVRMQPEEQSIASTSTHGNVWGWNMTNDGTVIVTCSSCCQDSYGVKNYAMSISDFYTMMLDLASLLSGSSITWVGDVAKDLAQVFAVFGGAGSWKDNIIKAVYVPIPLDRYSGTTEDICLGGVNTGHSAKRVAFSSVVYESQGKALSLPWTNDQTTYEFLKNPRWCTIQVQVPGGYQEIDPTLIKDQQSIGLSCAIDIITGDWSVAIREKQIGTGAILAAFSGNIATDITGLIGAETTGFTNFMHKTTELTAKFYGGYMASQAGTAAKSVNNAYTNVSLSDAQRYTASTTAYKAQQTYEGAAQVSSGISAVFQNSGLSINSASGSIGGRNTAYFLGDGGYNGQYVLRIEGFKPKDLANYEAYCDRYGYPCNAYLQLNDISGYCQCAGATVSAATGATEGDKSTINSYLNSGIYIE